MPAYPPVTLHLASPRQPSEPPLPRLMPTASCGPAGGGAPNEPDHYIMSRTTPRPSPGPQFLRPGSRGFAGGLHAAATKTEGRRRRTKDLRLYGGQRHQHAATDQPPRYSVIGPAGGPRDARGWWVGGAGAGEDDRSGSAGPETPHEERGEVKGGGRRDSPRCLGRAPTRPRQAEESAVDGPNILR